MSNTILVIVGGMLYQGITGTKAAEGFGEAAAFFLFVVAVALDAARLIVWVAARQRSAGPRHGNGIRLVG